MSDQGDCLFCKIVARKIPSAVVYENDQVLGFKDINPQAPVHVLFVTKKHITGVNEVKLASQGIIDSLVVGANQVARELKVLDSGYRIVINCNRDAGQSVDHLHAHLLGGRMMAWPPG